MTKELFRFRTDDEDMIKFLRTKKEFSSFAIEIFKAIKDGKLIEPNEANLKQQEKEADLRYKIARADCKESEAIWWKTFKCSPSSTAKDAMKTDSKKSFRELTEEEVNQIVKFVALEKTFDGYRITCLQCNNEFSYKDRLEALNDSARHLQAVHGKVILQK